MGRAQKSRMRIVPRESGRSKSTESWSIMVDYRNLPQYHTLEPPIILKYNHIKQCPLWIFNVRTPTKMPMSPTTSIHKTNEMSGWACGQKTSVRSNPLGSRKTAPMIMRLLGLLIDYNGFSLAVPDCIQGYL